VKVCAEDVKPTVAPPLITISAPVVLLSVIELSALRAALTPETASFIFDTRSEYELARETDSPFIVKAASMLKVPIASEVNVLNAFAFAP
jgi:hypothetical protein